MKFAVLLEKPEKCVGGTYDFAKFQPYPWYFSRLTAVLKTENPPVRDVGRLVFLYFWMAETFLQDHMFVTFNTPFRK